MKKILKKIEELILTDWRFNTQIIGIVLLTTLFIDSVALRSIAMKETITCTVIWQSFIILYSFFLFVFLFIRGIRSSTLKRTLISIPQILVMYYIDVMAMKIYFNLLTIISMLVSVALILMLNVFISAIFEEIKLKVEGSKNG